ncbi:hypothetical protein U1E44_05420 [Arenibacter sp. GZD96]|uniref:hypothetical protein n=1 Tax=Aurantibrevibacter litoralis TaxID=3106030 RepID=UPI002AFF1BA0|nr:hypothetical protein [Arenibacter sp. GZD-96]MEA1785520.1 hypothetical protein [Arenibacter sp. GZD-96]
MGTRNLEQLITEIFEELELLIPTYKSNPEDWQISEGNVAVCIITEQGKVFGKLYGSDKLRQRSFFKIAWHKASQVWITGQKTGVYEQMVFSGKVDPEAYSPIELPDLIGWVGGQPIAIDNETQLSIGFSGFRGFNDIAIVQKAIDLVLKK